MANGEWRIVFFFSIRYSPWRHRSLVTGYRSLMFRGPRRDAEIGRIAGREHAGRDRDGRIDRGESEEKRGVGRVYLFRRAHELREVERDDVAVLLHGAEPDRAEAAQGDDITVRRLVILIGKLAHRTEIDHDAADALEGAARLGHVEP